MSDFNPNYWGAKIRAAAQSAEPAMTSEREAFEKWAKYKWFDLHRNKDNESYTDPQTHRMWESWQARAHLSQPAQAVDVEKVREVIADLSRRANTGFNTNDRARCGHWARELTAALTPKDSR